MAHLIYLICQICQICQRVRIRPHRSVRPWEADLWGRGRPICEAVGGRSVRPNSDSLTDHMTLWWEAVLGLPRPPTAPTASQIGLPRPHRSASHGLPRPHRSASQIWTLSLAQTDHMTNCGRPRRWEAVGGPIWPPKHSASHIFGLPWPPMVSLANQMTGNRVRESMGGRGRPNSASHALGLPHFVIKSNFR